MDLAPLRINGGIPVILFQEQCAILDMGLHDAPQSISNTRMIHTWPLTVKSQLHQDLPKFLLLSSSTHKMHSESDSVHGTPNVVLGSKGPSPTQEATTLNKNAGPHVNSKGPGQGRASGSGQPMRMSSSFL
jgi:hypothetical protein